MSAATTASRPKLVEPGKDLAAIRKSGNMIAKDAGGTLVSDFFEANRSAIEAVLPQHMTPDRMMKIALRALRTTPKLMQCTLASLFGAVVTCAQLGLEPNTPQGHIYLIPFENKRKNITEVQIIIGYKGLIDLARRSGQIVSISARAVYSNDELEISLGTHEDIVHKMFLGGDRGHIVGFYAVAQLKDGGTQFEFMSASDVNAIRDGSQGYKTAVRFAKPGVALNTPWDTNYDQMGCKTVARRLTKWLPMSIELANASALDERADRNQTQGLDAVLDGEFSIVAEEEDDVAAEAARDAEDAGQSGNPEQITQDQTPKLTVSHDPETGELVGEIADKKPSMELFK
jgi:recombination protein RecT